MEEKREWFAFVSHEDAEAEEIYGPSVTYWKDAWRRLKKNKVAVFGIIVLVLLAVMAVFGPMMVKYDHAAIDLTNTNQWPDGVHWFGTDDVGRDIWSRVWMGARVSLFIALVAAVVQSTIGVIIGGISGYFGGIMDTTIMRAADVIDSIPFLVYVIVITMLFGTGMVPIIIAFALTGWIKMARLVRGQALQLKVQDYVTAAKGLGAGRRRIILHHMVPNMLGVIIVTLTMNIPNAIFTEAYLSYIGIGLQPPLTSWGQLADAGAKIMKAYPYQLIIPAVFISVTMLSLQLLGDGLRDALDPKLRK